METDKEELQLLPPLPKRIDLASATGLGELTTKEMTRDLSDQPLLDLNLSISTRPLQTDENKSCMKNVQALKQQAAEQIRLAAVEKAYAERVREMTRRELELAEKESARARLAWGRAQEEVEKAERMKKMATRKIGPACMEITCQACRQRFRP